MPYDDGLTTTEERHRANPLRKLLRVLYDTLREEIGTPVSLHRLIESPLMLRADLEATPRVIAANSVVPWHEWGIEPRRSRGELRGWKYHGGHYSGLHQVRDDLAHFGVQPRYV